MQVQKGGIVPTYRTLGALEVGEWSAPRFGKFTPGKDAVTII